ncbi:MAG: hypothetical protein HZA90_19460 [Verrucomicrobia bacterium]|nr:hypothetical protein [Verrucomicrobiota bacterium]
MLPDTIKTLAVSEVGFWVQWGLIIQVVAAWLALVVFMLFLLTRIGYRISHKHLKVTLLGIPVRRVRLDNIRNIHTHYVRFGEKWYNHLFLKFDQVLVIQKRRGLIKDFVITPEQRYVFKAELDRAIRNYMGLPPAPTVANTTTFERLAAQAAANKKTPPPANPPPGK